MVSATKCDEPRDRFRAEFLGVAAVVNLHAAWRLTFRMSATSLVASERGGAFGMPNRASQVFLVLLSGYSGLLSGAGEPE